MFDTICPWPPLSSEAIRLKSTFSSLNSHRSSSPNPKCWPVTQRGACKSVFSAPQRASTPVLLGISLAFCLLLLPCSTSFVTHLQLLYGLRWSATATSSAFLHKGRWAHCPAIIDNNVPGCTSDVKCQHSECLWEYLVNLIDICTCKYFKDMKFSFF